MSEITQARPYAKAIFDLASLDSSFEKWTEELNFLANVSINKDIQPLFASPKYTKEQKAELFLSVSNNITEYSKNLIKTLSDNNRLMLLPTILSLFITLSNDAQNKIDVLVRTAFELDDGQRQALEAAIKIKLSKSINVTYKIDSSLVGGVIIHAGDQVIDGSVKTRVEQLSFSMMAS